MTEPPPDPPHFAHTDPTGHRLYACPATYKGQPGVWIRANGVTLTGPVLTELLAALPLIVADAQAFGDDPGPRTPPDHAPARLPSRSRADRGTTR